MKTLPKLTYEELERLCGRQAVKIRGLRKALRQLEKRHSYAALRAMVCELEYQLGKTSKRARKRK